MNKIKILVHNATGSEKRPAELCLESGIIFFTSGNDITHISGKTVYKVIEEPVTVITAPQSEKKKTKKP